MQNFIVTVLLTALSTTFAVQADDLYVSCLGDKSLQKISGDSVSTIIAGKAFFPGLAVDHVGNLYLSNKGGNDILKYASVDGKLSNAPVVFARGLNGPGDIAFDPSGNLYEIEASGNINRFVSTGGVLSNKPDLYIDGSAEQANLVGNRAPSNLIFDQEGNLYVAITIGGILKFSNSPTGLALLPDEKPFSTVSRVRQMAFDQKGNLFAANHLAGDICVYKYPKTEAGLSGTPEIFSTGHGLHAPTGVAFDSAGNLYVGNWGYDHGTEILEYQNVNGVLSNIPFVFGSDFASPVLVWCVKSESR